MKNKKVFVIIILLLFPLLTNALSYPDLDSKIVEIYDMNDNKLIYEINKDKKASIASLTKIVTTITAIENIKDLDETVEITEKILSTVRWDASIAGLKAGDKLTYRDLLYASMLPSGADATNAIAILSSGSIDNFVNKMNDLVKKLKLSNTHFVNVTGLDAEGHYSTADDVRKILSYALNNELFRKIYTTKKYTLSNGLTVKSTISTYNKNSNLNTSSIIGSKTGFTEDAGYCLSSISNINSHEFIIIVLNATHKDGKYYNFVDTINLIDFLLDNYNNQVLVKKDKTIRVLPIILSKTDKYIVKSPKEVTLYLPKDYDIKKLKIDYKGLEELSFNNKVGDKIGTISYYYDNKLISKSNIVLDTKLEISIKKVLRKYYYIIIGIPLLIVCVIILMKRKRRFN